MNRIRTSKHTTKFSNTNKIENIDALIHEYRRCASILMQYMWDNHYSYFDSKETLKHFNTKLNQLDAPSMITSDIITKSGLNSFLTGRMLKCCLTQVAGMLKASVEKQRKRLYILEQEKKEKNPRKKRRQFIKKLKCNIPQIPYCGNIKMELNSICATIQDEEDKHFDSFLQLTSITKDKWNIKIPIQHHRHSRKLESQGKMLNSFLISENNVEIRWELNKVEQKPNGKTIGIDQGINDLLALSNGTFSMKEDAKKHTQSSIMLKACRAKKGSKGFKRAKAHQKNFVNQSINALNLTDTKEIKLEKIWNIGYKQSRTRYLSTWQNTLIEDKIQKRCEDEGIRFILNTCTYRSQRCSSPECGYVKKSNRKGKLFKCKHCGNTMDSDTNSAMNQVIELPEIPYGLRLLNLNRSKEGFFWKLDGVFDSEGRSLQSLPHVEDKN